MKKAIFLLIMALMLSVSLVAQAENENLSNNENRATNAETRTPITGSYLTINRNIDFQAALKIIETYSLQYERKNIINTSSYTGNVPFQINNIHWKEAFIQLIKDVDLVLEEKPGAYFVMDVAQDQRPPDVESEYNIHDKMVRINATFLDVDKGFMNSIGINWSTISNGKVIGAINFSAGSRVDDSILNAEYSRSDPYDGGTIEVSALLDFIESNNKGTVLARPNITVLNGKTGYVQVGQDFSIKTRDENGNTTDEFFSTGIMLTVTPIILEEEGFEVVYLTSSVEKSSLVSHNATTGIIVNRNQARSDNILFDGEETVIAGLMSTDHTTTRSGIPILKDLPWWVFGLKYIFGYNSTRSTQREMIVILKVEIISPAKIRIQEDIRLRETYDRMREEFKNIGNELDTNNKKK